MATEYDEGYWPVVDPFQEIAVRVVERVHNSDAAKAVRIGLDGRHIGEQIVAGVALLIIGAGIAKAYSR